MIGQDFQQQLKRYADINLQTPTRQNMKDTRGKECNRWLVSTRRLVETVIRQLTERFNIQKVWARDRWHLTHRIIGKILAHTIAFTISTLNGYKEKLPFDSLISP